ncbi:hypothetical protein AVEN_270311-1, partial [Araneus ventricosus]
MRSYHQVQTWLGNEKDPLKWGGCTLHQASSLRKQRRIQHQYPFFNTLPVLAKKGCTNACGCRKAGLHCSLLCKNCIGQSCENPMPVILDNESEEGDAPAPIDMVDE